MGERFAPEWRPRRFSSINTTPYPAFSKGLQGRENVTLVTIDARVVAHADSGEAGCANLQVLVRSGAKTRVRQRNPARLAEGVGFEPTIRFPVYTLSKRAP